LGEKRTANPVTAWHDDKQTRTHGLHQKSTDPENQIACEANSSLIFKFRRESYPQRDFLVYLKSYSYTIGVTITKKVN